QPSSRHVRPLSNVSGFPRVAPTPIAMNRSLANSCIGRPPRRLTSGDIPGCRGRQTVSKPSGQGAASGDLEPDLSGPVDRGAPTIGDLGDQVKAPARRLRGCDRARFHVEADPGIPDDHVQDALVYARRDLDHVART